MDITKACEVLLDRTSKTTSFSENWIAFVMNIPLRFTVGTRKVWRRTYDLCVPPISSMAGRTKPQPPEVWIGIEAIAILKVHISTSPVLLASCDAAPSIQSPMLRLLCSQTTYVVVRLIMLYISSMLVPVRRSSRQEYCLSFIRWKVSRRGAWTCWRTDGWNICIHILT